MRTVNDFTGCTDSDRIENALREIEDGMLILPRRVCDIEPERDYWLIDRAILLPENTTVVLKNCKIKLSDSCRDNFFRSANCGLGVEDPKPMRNIHIHGEGLCILEGADHPRAVGDGSKILSCPCPKKADDLIRLADWVDWERRMNGELNFDDMHSHSYGTDAGKNEESQYGDWRGIGILFANVSDFSIENLRIVDSHGWGISLEACCRGSISHIDFDACMAKEIDGMLQNMENQDGVDLRNGCHDIVISDITGGTGDDLIALTAIASPKYLPGGSLCNTHVMHSDWNRRERDIHDIIIRNVSGYSKGGICWIIRLLPAYARIWNVVIDGVIDTSPAGFRAGGVLLMGEADGAYGKNEPESMSDISVSNMICNSQTAVTVNGYLQNSAFTNVINRNPDCAVIQVTRPGGFKNVALNGIVTVGKEILQEKY